MPQVARIGDPISHGGAIITGSDNVFANGIGVARVNDLVNCAQHGIKLLIEGSDTVWVNGRGCVRVGDQAECGAIVTAGSENVIAG